MDFMLLPQTKTKKSLTRAISISFAMSDMHPGHMRDYLGLWKLKFRSSCQPDENLVHSNRSKKEFDVQLTLKYGP